MTRPQVSEETILQVSKTTLTNGQDNLDALAEFGLTAEALNQFDTNIQTAEALPGETANRIDLRQLTQDKEEALDACYRWGRKLRARIQLAFGKNSNQAKSFPSKDFQNAVNSESSMMTVMETLIKLAGQYHSDLTAFGQTDAIRDSGTNLLEPLREADAVQELQKDTKKSATQDRYQAFQTIYDSVNRINKIGRLVFENDPVKLTLFESKW